MMYAKLIYRNLKRSTKEYAIYIMTLVLAVTLMYAFNGIALSGEVMVLAEEMNAFAVVTVLASIIIVFVLAWLVYYISKFIIEKRSREFGLYMLMGMSRKQVSRMFLVEQIGMGIFAYVIGCLFGIVMYQVLQAIIMQIFQIGYEFRITFSFAGALLTLFYFFLMFSLELFREHRYLKKKKIHDLLYSERKNEAHKSDGKRFVLILVFAILFYFAGLKTLDLAIANEMDSAVGLFVSVALLIASIIFIYFALSYVITLVINRKKHIKYHGNTLYLSSQICSRLKTSRLVLALLSILTLSSFVLVCMGLKFNQSQEDGAALYPFDIQVESVHKDVPIDTSSISSYVQEEGIAYEELSYKNYTLKYNAKRVVNGIAWEEIYSNDNNFDYTYMQYTDYKTLLDMLDQKPMAMGDDEYLIVTHEDFKATIERNAKGYTFEGLSFGGVEIQNVGNLVYNALIFVVPDKVVEHASVLDERYVGKSEQDLTKEQIKTIEDRFYADNMGNQIEGSETRYLNYLINFKQSWIAYMQGSTVTFTFTLIYMAIILSCVSATVLAIQQMSDTWKQKKSYQMLGKMGVNKKEIYSILRKQIAVYFFVPFIVPVLYIFPIISSINNMFRLSFSRGSMIPYAFFAILFYLGIYMVYYLLAYFNCKHSIDA